jgi:hypothetical protein
MMKTGSRSQSPANQNMWPSLALRAAGVALPPTVREAAAR